MESYLVVFVFCALLFGFGWLLGARQQYQEDIHEFLSCIEVKEEPIREVVEEKKDSEDVMNQLSALLDYQPKGRTRK